MPLLRHVVYRPLSLGHEIFGVEALGRFTLGSVIFGGVIFSKISLGREKDALCTVGVRRSNWTRFVARGAGRKVMIYRGRRLRR